MRKTSSARMLYGWLTSKGRIGGYGFRYAEDALRGIPALADSDDPGGKIFAYSDSGEASSALSRSVLPSSAHLCLFLYGEWRPVAYAENVGVIEHDGNGLDVYRCECGYLHGADVSFLASEDAGHSIAFVCPSCGSIIDPGCRNLSLFFCENEKNALRDVAA